jgi:putative PEP-CTERM system TPR-repeat lipoprotein
MFPSLPRSMTRSITRSITHSMIRPLPGTRRLVLVTALTLALSACVGKDSPEALLGKASKAIDEYDRKTAEIHLKNLLQTDPEHAQGRMLLARVYAQSRDERAAVGEWRRALEAGADPDQIVPGLLASLFGSGQSDAMDAVIEKYPLKSATARAEVLYWRAQALWMKRKADQAAEQFRAALALDAEHHPSQLALIRMKMFSDPAGAKSELDALLPRLKKPAEALQIQAQMALVRKDQEAALESLRQAVKAEPRHLPSLTQLLAVLIEAGQLDEAEKRFEQMSALAKTDLNTWLMRANIDFRRNRLDAASQNIEFVLKNAPGLPMALTLGTQISLARGELERAEQLSRALVDANPDNLQGYLLRATVALARNEPERASQLTQPLIDRGIRNAPLLAIAGEAALRRNQTAQAVDLLSRAAELEPTNAQTRLNLGVASLARGNLQAGFSELEKAIALDPTSSQADLVLIGERLRRSDWPAALKAVEQYAQRNPKQALPSNLKGTVLLAQGNTEAARASFEDALKKEPGFFPAVSNLVRLDLTDAQPDRARTRLEAFTQKYPKEVNATLALVTLLRSQNASGDLILSHLRKAYQDNPGSSELLIALSVELVAQKRTAEAIPLVQQAVAQQPEDLRLLELLGNLYRNNKDNQQAIETFSRIVRIKPDLAVGHMKLAQVKSELGDHAGAAASFKRAGELEDGKLESRFGMARAMVQEGRRDEALRIARDLQKNQPKNSAGLMLEGDLLASEQRWKEAAAIYRRAFGVERTAIGAAREHQALLRAGDTAQAASVLQSSLAALPNNGLLRIYAADQALAQSRWKEAVEHYTVGLRGAPNNGVAQNNMAWALLQLKDYAEAEKHARIAVQVLPLSGETADTLGIILLSSGQHQKALATLKHAAQLAPMNPQIRLHLVKALQTVGDTQEMQTQRDLWIKQFPDSPLRKELDQMAMSATKP